MYYITKLLMAD